MLYKMIISNKLDLFWTTTLFSHMGSHAVEWCCNGDCQQQ